jgi:hypothetical protein
MLPVRTLKLGSALLAAGVFLALPAAVRAETSPPGDIPDNQAFLTFDSPTYSLRVPEGWRRVGRGSHVTFNDKYNSIQVDLSKNAARPTVVSVRKTELPRLRATVRGFAAPTVTRVTRVSGVAILIRYRAASARNPVTGKTVTNDVERYEFWKSGKLAVLTLQAPRGSDNVDPWRTVTDSFTWAR